MQDDIGAATEMVRDLFADRTLRRKLEKYQTAPDGYASGISFYSDSKLIAAMTQSVLKYKRTFNIYPDLAHPKNFNEKVLSSKFFSFKKIPESGNKLLTSRFLPERIKSDVLVPEVVWRSEEAQLSSNFFAPGNYYLKVNHGSGLIRRVRMPLQEDEIPVLEKLFSRFLAIDYGIEDGEWWYNTFDKEIFLEKSVSSDEYSIAWMFYVFSGSVELVAAYQKRSDGDRSSWLDGNFNPLRDQNLARKRVAIDGVSREILEKMRDAASLIGAAMPFVRVDLLIGDDGNIYISEITHAPGNGLTPWSDDINDHMGRKWHLEI